MRLRATHTATFIGEVKVGERELGAPIFDTKPVLEAPCRFHSPDGESYVRTASGELEREKPSVTIRIHGFDPATGDLVDAADRLETGMDVELSGGGSADTAEGATYTVENVQLKRRRGNIPEALEMTVSQQA